MTLRTTVLPLQGAQSPLYVACLRGNIEMVQLLVHHHAAIDQPCDVSNALYTSTSLILISEDCSLNSQHTHAVSFTSSLLSCLPQDEYAATPLLLKITLR